MWTLQDKKEFIFFFGPLSQEWSRMEQEEINISISHKIHKWLLFPGEDFHVDITCSKCWLTSRCEQNTDMIIFFFHIWVWPRQQETI